MSTGKHIDLICLIVALATILLTGVLVACAPNASEVSSEQFSAVDLDGDWSAASSGTVDLTARTATGGAYFDGDGLHIISSGSWTLTGRMEGCVVISASKNDTVRLILDSAEIVSLSGPAVEVEEAGKVILTLADGTENVISGEGIDASSKEDGAVYSRDDLTVNGGGSLSVTGSVHGIVANDDLVITGGTLSVTAGTDGIHANDSVRICEALIDISAGDDGVTVSNDEGTGYFYMESGTLNVTRCMEGVEACNITVAGGTLDLRPTDDGLNASGGADPQLTISGGTVRVVNPTGRDADGLDSNGSITISGGEVYVSVSASSCALDAGVESGGSCLVNGGTVVASGGSGMAESFDSASEQGFITANISGGEGAQVTLTDADGNVLIDCQVPVGFGNIILSCPGLKVGDSVTLSVDGETTQLTVTNESVSGQFGGMTGGRGGFGGKGTGVPHGGTGTRPEGFGRGGMMQDGTQDGTSNDTPENTQRTGGAQSLVSISTDTEGSQPPSYPEDGTFTRPGGALPFDRGTMDATGGMWGDRGGRFGMDGAAQDADSQAPGSPVTASQLAAVGVSVLALLFGLIVAFKAKH